MINSVSDLLFGILGKPQDSTFVVIDGIAMENWGAAACRCLNVASSFPKRQPSRNITHWRRA
ncbi:tautomerase family protein [Rhizobium leguminosarum]|uniref:tautomerase family protein n=1 Tax=Rhizobium leguminosarum TaxID=384 RepID=UPI003D7C3596